MKPRNENKSRPNSGCKKDPQGILLKAHTLRKAGDKEESRAFYKDYLLFDSVLLWLAKLSKGVNLHESLSAAELAIELEPHNEIAQRALLSIKSFERSSCIKPEDSANVKMIVSATGMTLTEARSIKWPFNRINKPIGEIIDNGKIGYRDLAWAATNENIYDHRLRDAAKTILLFNLLGAKPKEISPPLKIVIGSRHSEKREKNSLLFFGVSAGVMLTSGGFLFYISLLNLGKIHRVLPGVPVDIPFFFILFLMFCLYLIVLKYNRNYICFKIGRWGEEKALEQFRNSLDGRWTLYRNFEWPNRKWGDADLVLVGPGGVWVFEVKAYTGQVRNNGDLWERRGKYRWYKIRQHPGKQTRRNAMNMKEFLQKKGAEINWVQAVVLWAGDASPYPEEKGMLTVEDPQTPVWHVDQIPENILELWQGRSLSDEELIKVNCILTQAVEDTRKQTEK